MQASDNKKQPWDCLLHDVHLATCADGGYGAILHGALGIAQGRIAWVGALADLPDAPEILSQDVIQCGGSVWVTPGLIDSRSSVLSHASTQEPDDDDKALVRAAMTLRLLLREGVTTIGLNPPHVGVDPDGGMGNRLVDLARLLEQEAPVSFVFLEAVTPASLSDRLWCWQGNVPVLLPLASYYESNAKIDLRPIRAASTHIALASAYVGAPPCASAILVMNMAQRLYGLTPCDSLRAMTCDGAKALGMDATHGALVSGKQADLAFWQVEHPDLIAAQLGGAPCIGLMKNGQLYRPGE